MRFINRGSRGKILFGVFISCFLASAGTQLAFAGSASSATGFYTAGSTQYLNYATVETSSGRAEAFTQTRANTIPTPSGWAGARGRLFSSGGALSCEGTNQYNTATGAGVFGYSCIRYTSGAWYSYGVSYGWNGSGYSAFYSFISPNQNS